MQTRTSLGWIGTGRMGYAMAERLAKGGCDSRRLEPHQGQSQAAREVRRQGGQPLGELSTKDILFVMVSTYEDV